jgi:hypothetical protein
MVLASCEGIKTVPADMEGEQLECVNEKAKAILWVDWKYGEDLSDYRIVRTAKAHVNVYSDGTFRIISFCKRQKPEVVEYLKKRAAVYTIRKFFFENGYIEPGEQYLQLKYVPGKVNKK